MLREEKIDLLKKKFPKPAFDDHFTDWKEIMKKLEAKFLIKENSNFHFNNWRERMKGKVALRTIPHNVIWKELEKLDTHRNYFVIVMPGADSSKHYVYDCSAAAMEALLSFTGGDFFIADKNYEWMVYFSIDRENQTVIIYKTGSECSPFER